ncbi:DUF1553 domain-containing protein [Galbibacter sp. BG1]|nr:DUF1553 domain-containing protein [Galbibacter sp. BG1]
MALSVNFVACSVDVPKEVQVAYEDLPEQVDYNFHVKPILSDRCFNCHGPDENTRKAGLRLDVKEGMFRKLESGNKAFKSGSPYQSEVIARILSDDEELMMPPPESHLKLSAREKALILKWVEQGAEWKKHWAFIPPENKGTPKLDEENPLINNEIDEFVYDKLRQKGYNFSPKAPKEQLLRRLALDLTGLPPTLEELDLFLNDESPDAYEKMVDKYLSSNANAEKLTLDWLDLSRYADSHGLHADGWRSMWPWRDWVINAFKDNMPYDQFVTWQLAGDLLPNPSRDQILATAFNRNTPMTGEGGVIDEEFRLSYVFDRAETTSTAFLGLTVACAKCHDHKFDPISQKDYYEMSAFFNNVRELGMTGDDGNFGPLLTLTSKEEQKKADSLKKKIRSEEKELAITKKELASLEQFMDEIPTSFKKEDLIGYYPLEDVRKRKPNDPKYKGIAIYGNYLNNYIIDDNAYATMENPGKIVKGVVGNAIEITGDYDEIHLQNNPNFEFIDEFSAGLFVNTSKRKKGKTQTIMGTSGEKNGDWRGWEFYLDSTNSLNVRLMHALPENYFHIKTLDTLQKKKWYHVAFTYNGSGKADDVDIYINGSKVSSEIVHNKLYKSIKTYRTIRPDIIEPRTLKVGKSYRKYTGEDGIFKGMVDEIYFYKRKLTSGEIRVLAGTSLEEINSKNRSLVKEYWIEKTPQVAEVKDTLKELRKKWLEVMNPTLEIMVMEEMPEKRTSYLYKRGEYNQPGETVNANTLSALPAFPDSLPKNRLGLAKWLFMDNNPLTARVAVNRYWQMVFGSGLVDTPQDFGVQGNLPSHPELLDWLAIYFRENNWNVKKLLKKMVMSHTYQQISTPTEAMALKDPENTYLSRSNTYRLSAEAIRDNALAVSGLLVTQVGGASVKPYMPADLWAEKSSFSYKLLNYKEDMGDSLYRRSMYTFIRRTSPHPAMTAFDAPSRDVCTIERESTNTPLQALVLLNDEQFIEASRVLAERVQKEKEGVVENQIEMVFRLATSRKPSSKELQLLKELYGKQYDYFKNTPKATKDLLKVGEKPFDNSLDEEKTAALTIVSNTILNHDETFMRR